MVAGVPMTLTASTVTDAGCEGRRIEWDGSEKSFSVRAASRTSRYMHPGTLAALSTH